ncbi:MAG: hypothetical protein NZZ41_05460 [Candidatus Dojkabacteria bacterium]|nr:hypothetical protein [Candidatus Dojkabacteria bacterium]
MANFFICLATVVFSKLEMFLLSKIIFVLFLINEFLKNVFIKMLCYAYVNQKKVFISVLSEERLMKTEDTSLKNLQKIYQKHVNFYFLFFDILCIMMLYYFINDNTFVYIYLLAKIFSEIVFDHHKPVIEEIMNEYKSFL